MKISPPGRRASEYRNRAASARETAEAMTDPDSKRMMLDAADMWTRLADWEENSSPPSSRPGLESYWITTDGLGGVGISAHSEQDARTLFALAWPTGRKVLQVLPLRDVSDLDPDHVVPNMGNLLRRGIWYPMGYEHVST
jgi:hypothetical protein